MRPLAAAAGLVAALVLAAPAAAQVDLVSPEVWHGLLDIRAVAADGEEGFAEGTFGKLRYGGDEDGDWRLDADIATAALGWRPRLGWDLTGVVEVTYQPYQEEHQVDISEAYLSYRPTPHSPTRFTARAGLYYPAISMEHDAPFWGLRDTITPSAMNSWVGEELKVIGIEGSIAREFEGGARLALTVGVFEGDDTSGTLLTYRGWALHDQQATGFNAFELPPLGPFSQYVQPRETYSIREIDRRLGYYVRLEWRPINQLELEAFHYTNQGDLVGVTMTGQWAWDTDFTALGARWTIDERTRLLGQGMLGRTRDGFPTPQGLFGDVSFRTAYLLASRDIGPSTLTARLDAFDTTDHTTQDTYPNDEHGWAAMAAWRYPFTDHIDLRVEALHVWSSRPARAYSGLPASQGQTQLQSSLRFTF